MTATSEQSERFTQGALLWPLLTLAAPLVATQLLQTLYNIADTFWVGRLGQDAVSALSFSWPIVFLLVSVGGGMTGAGTILISQHTGAENDGRVSHVAGQTLVFVTALSVAISVVGYLLTPTLLQVIGTEAGTPIHEMAVTYTRYVFLGLYFMLGFFVFQALLRGWGDTKTPMYLMVGSVALNVVLDPILILGFADNPLFAWLGLEGLAATAFAATGFTGLGVEGAAIATIFSRGLAAVAGLWLLFSGRVGIELSLSDLRPDLPEIRKIVRVGAPLSVEQSTQALSVTVMTALVALVGSDAVAAYGIGGRLTSLVWLPMVGMGMAVETVVGQNLGAGERARARRTVLLASGILVAVFLVASVVVTWFAPAIVGVFITGAGAAAVVDHGTAFLRIVAPTWAVMAVFHMINGAFHGAGSTRLSMGLGLLTLWGFRIVAAAVLVVVVGMGAPGAWYGIAASNVAAAVAGIAFFLRGHWLDDVIEEESGEDDGDADATEVATPAD
ncbi:MATE family efflux transporter [Halomicroarcula sp. S1AR25-4]|uniref:MATE family efflux transporter n=1 Tax=Haloarcula sp. S1AR25-4 TaxID=2950538 RepID=UPI00287513E2|nr:MATE family efflux transporter [Halomicroarcula sp. S1AR25-4]MDS0278866.1 MATE family efflux transporter [Halomicroarcula sp. S1AR25-4]